MDAWIRCLYMYIIILRSILIHLSDCSQTGYGHKIVIIQTRLFESLNNFSSPGPWSASWINCGSRDHTLKCLDKVVITGIVFLTPPPIHPLIIITIILLPWGAFYKRTYDRVVNILVSWNGLWWKFFI